MGKTEDWKKHRNFIRVVFGTQELKYLMNLWELEINLSAYTNAQWFHMLVIKCTNIVVCCDPLISCIF